MRNCIRAADVGMATESRVACSSDGKMVESLYEMQDPREKAILDEVLRLRHELKVLKLDKSTYVKSQDVIKIYEQVIKQTCALEEYRTSDPNVDKSGRGISPRHSHQSLTL